MSFFVRGVLAVIGGYAVTAITVMLVVSFASAIFGRFGPMPNAPYIIANIAGSFAAAMLGGFVAAFAGGSPGLLYAVILAAIVLIAGGAMARSGPQPGQPAWYPWVIPLVGAAGATTGGFLHP